MKTSHLSADIEPRHGFLPPRYLVWRFPAGDDDGWRRVPPVLLLTDPHGEDVPERQVTLKLAWDDAGLRLKAVVEDDAPVVKPDLAPESPDFWTQDHIEFRFLPDPNYDLVQTQFIFAPGGRWFCSHPGVKVALREAAPACPSKAGDGCWSVEACVPFRSIGLPTPQSGTVLKGLLAHTRWADGFPDITCMTAAVWGFSHAERFAEFVFKDVTPCPVTLTSIRFPPGDLRRGVNKATLTLANNSEREVPGTLHVVREDGRGGREQAECLDFRLPPGDTEVALDLYLDRPAYSRYRFEAILAGQAHELGAVTLRAGVPEIRMGDPDLRHPYLLFDPKGLEELRNKARRPGFERIAESLRLREEDLADAGPPAEGHGVCPGLGFASRAAGYLSNWILSGDPRVIRLATKAIRAADQALVLGPYTDLHEGGASSGLAMAYDAFHPWLSDEERGDWVRVLTRFLQLYLATARKRHWNCTAIPNANPACNSGGGLLGLALLKEKPEQATEVLKFARKFIWNWLDYCNGKDGGNTEGAQYWQYGTENFLFFALALERVLGSDDGLLSQPAVRNCMNMIRVGLCNDGSMHGFNDTVPLPVGGPIAWFVAGRFGDDLGLWYGDHVQRVCEARQAAGKGTPYATPGLWGLLMRPDRPERFEQPPLPRVMAMEDIQYSVMRSGTNYDCRLVAGLKGSRPPYTHHNQPDTGSVFIDLRGERLVIDPGYYKPAPTDHSLPLIGDAAPQEPRGFVGRITGCAESEDIRYLACDSTAAYRGAARRAVRHLVMAGEEGLVLLDDIVPADPAVTVTAQYQTGGLAEPLRGGRAVLVHGKRAWLRLELVGNEELSLECHPERRLDDIHWGYYFAECRWFPVTAKYVPHESEPLVTVFLDAPEQAPGCCAVERGGNGLAVLLPSGRRVCFELGTEGWRFVGL